MPMTLIDYYLAAVAGDEIHDDASQRQVIEHLQRVLSELEMSQRWFSRLCKKQRVSGIYMYGPVGVGKTYLMDLFYEHMTEPRKARFHFHHFMQQVDNQLRRLQGQKNPVRRIAADLAKTVRVLCLDEFLMHDVADAMIMAELLNALFEHGIVLIATANTAPDDLYLHGVHRERFLPAIALIKQHCQVLVLSNARDYRLGRAPLKNAYLYPLDDRSLQSLIQQFNALDDNKLGRGELMVQQRLIPYVNRSHHAIWFEFHVICNIPRSQLDYLEIADRFDTVFLSGIPVLTPDDTTRALMLIHFIDVMYDRGIHLVISAQVPAASLYVKGPMHKSFQRTLSRLEEMQSIDYLHRHEHRNVSNFLLV